MFAFWVVIGGGGVVGIRGEGEFVGHFGSFCVVLVQYWFLFEHCALGRLFCTGMVDWKRWVVVWMWGGRDFGPMRSKWVTLLQYNCTATKNITISISSVGIMRWNCVVERWCYWCRVEVDVGQSQPFPLVLVPFPSIYPNIPSIIKYDNVDWGQIECLKMMVLKFNEMIWFWCYFNHH